MRRLLKLAIKDKMKEDLILPPQINGIRTRENKQSNMYLQEAKL